MLAWLWAAFFLISSMVGVKVFEAVFKLPREEALLPALVCIPLVVLCAFSATQLLAAWREDESDW
jgi:hypothetical protein